MKSIPSKALGPYVTPEGGLYIRIVADQFECDITIPPDAALAAAKNLIVIQALTSQTPQAPPPEPSAPLSCEDTSLPPE